MSGAVNNLVEIPGILFKTGKHEHIVDLQRNGAVYLNTLEYFRKIEDNEIRGDSSEGATEIHQIKKLQLFIKDKFIAEALPDSNAQLKVFNQDLFGNIFSLYAINKDHLLPKFEVDKRLLKFGEKTLIIKNGFEFSQRLVEAFKAMGYSYKLGMVKYYDKDKYSGKIDVFSKPSILDYQYEFRYFINNKKNEPVKNVESWLFS